MTDSSARPDEELPVNPQSDATLLQEQVNLLEAEMESLRRRMKLLESRAGRTIELSKDATDPSPDETVNPTQAPDPLTATATSSATPAVTSNQHVSPTTRRRRTSSSKNSSSSRKRSTRPRKRSRGDKLKRQLLFGYSLVIGTALLAVLVLMIFNLFGDKQIFGGGGEVSRSSGGDSSEEFEFDIETAPDLQELRDALENAE